MATRSFADLKTDAAKLRAFVDALLAEVQKHQRHGLRRAESFLVAAEQLLLQAECSIEVEGRRGVDAPKLTPSDRAQHREASGRA